jgi:hypothetical protein
MLTRTQQPESKRDEYPTEWLEMIAITMDFLFFDDKWVSLNNKKRKTNKRTKMNKLEEEEKKRCLSF